MKNMPDEEKWENGELGASEEFVRKVSKKREQQIDEALNLSVVTIRLDVDLIEELKVIARDEGVTYQALIRQILTRYIINKQQD